MLNLQCNYIKLFINTVFFILLIQKTNRPFCVLQKLEARIQYKDAKDTYR